MDTYLQSGGQFLARSVTGNSGGVALDTGDRDLMNPGKHGQFLLRNCLTFPKVLEMVLDENGHKL